jgi:hypothetical protein
MRALKEDWSSSWSILIRQYPSSSTRVRTVQQHSFKSTIHHWPSQFSMNTPFLWHMAFAISFPASNLAQTDNFEDIQPGLAYKSSHCSSNSLLSSLMTDKHWFWFWSPFHSFHSGFRSCSLVDKFVSALCLLLWTVALLLHLDKLLVVSLFVSSNNMDLC